MPDPDPTLMRQALAELRDINKDKRRTAVMKLGMMGGDEAIRTLIMLVKNPTEDLIVRGRAAMMLGKIGDTRAVQPLIEALDSPGYQTRLSAVQSLGQLGDRRAIVPLLRVMDTDNDRCHEAAKASLKMLGYDLTAEHTGALEPQPEPEV